MITAVFSRADGRYVSFEVSGHSGLADSGSDILCAAVSGATELAANLISGETSVDEDTAKVSVLIPHPDDISDRVVDVFKQQLSAYSEEYPKNIRIFEQESVL